MGHVCKSTTALLLAALPLVGCASSTAQGRAGECTSDLAQDIRSIDTVLDSAALVQDLASFWTPGIGLTLVTLSPDSTRVLAADYFPEIVPIAELALTTAMRRHARPGAPLNEPVRLVLKDETGIVLRRVRAFRGCEPEIINREEVQAALVRESRDLRFTSSVTVVVDAFVGVEGRVLDTRIGISSTWAGANDAAVRVMRIARYTPARIEGIAAAIWTRTPVTFQVVAGE